MKEDQDRENAYADPKKRDWAQGWSEGLAKNFSKKGSHEIWQVLEFKAKMIWETRFVTYF